MTDWYTASGNPTQGSAGASNVLRSEYNSISAAFSKMPALTGYGGLLVGVNGSGTALQTYSYAEIASALTFVNLEYTGTLTGSTGVINIGSGQIYKNASGNVGIGTSSPTEKLTVYNGSIKVGGSAQGKLLGYSASNTQIMDFGVATGTGTATDIGLYNLHASGIIGIGTNSTERMRIDASGNVGIGTSSPSTKLHLLTASATNVEFRIANASSYCSVIENAAGEMQLYTPGTAMSFSTNGTEKMRIDSSGNVGIGTAAPNTKLDVNGAISISSGTTVLGFLFNDSSAFNLQAGSNAISLKIGTTSTQPIVAYTNGTERMRIDSTGALLVNQTTPDTGAKLSVTGGIKGTITSGTAVAASGTAIDFTGIPSWAKRITVMLNGVSTNGTSSLQVQIGAGSIVTTGYLAKCTSVSTAVGNSTSGASFTTGIGLLSNSAAGSVIGSISFMNISGNTWVASGILEQDATANTLSAVGNVTLSGTLDRIRLTTVNGTDAFDAGSVNILYEG